MHRMHNIFFICMEFRKFFLLFIVICCRTFAPQTCPGHRLSAAEQQLHPAAFQDELCSCGILGALYSQDANQFEADGRAGNHTS